MTASITEKKTWISLVAVVAAIGVVYLHVNECFWGFSTEAYWISADFIETFFYASVPLFFMVSGVTLLDYPNRYSTGIYFKKRVKKTVIPYLFWSVVYYLFFNCLGTYRNPISVQTLISQIMNFSAWNIFWFFPILFAVYLIIPVFANVDKEKKHTIYLYAAVVLLVVEIAVPLIDEALGCNIPFLEYRSGLEGYLAYVLLGYIIGNSDLSKPTRILSYIIAIAAFLIMFIGTYTKSVELGDVYRGYKGYTTIYCFAYSLGGFIFLKQCGNKLSEKPEKIVNTIKDYTFAIFLLHGFGISIVERLIRMVGIPHTNLIYRLIAPIFVVAGCMLVTKILRSVKFLSWMVPK